MVTLSPISTSRHETAERKLFAGYRVRRLRIGLGLTQTRMAEELGVSVSYFNLIERDQRPVTAQFLLKLAEVYQIDVRELSGDAALGVQDDLAQALGDPLFRGLDIPKSELRDVAQAAPSIAQAVVRLYAAYRELRQAHNIEDPGRINNDSAPHPLEIVRDIIQERGNHFPTLEAIAEPIADELRLTGDGLLTALKTRLNSKHGVQVRVLPLDVMPESLRRYDHHRRQLQLSELLDPPACIFQALVHLASLEARPAIDEIVGTMAIADDATRKLMRQNLSRYFAAATLLPYARFHAAAEDTNYDLALLAQRFGASFEHVAHRLTTLQRPTMRGVPFFLIRVDQAGNISKRFSAARFHFSKFGGSCALWQVHAAFRTPGVTLRQIVEMPDGTRYFTISRTVRSHALPWGQPSPEFAISLGCDIRHAHHLVYARGLDLDAPQATPIGINCALCPRDSCRQRSQPPSAARLIVDDRVRGPTPFVFSTLT